MHCARETRCPGFTGAQRHVRAASRHAVCCEYITTARVRRDRATNRQQENSMKAFDALANREFLVLVAIVASAVTLHVHHTMSPTPFRSRRRPTRNLAACVLHRRSRVRVTRRVRFPPTASCTNRYPKGARSRAGCECRSIRHRMQKRPHSAGVLLLNHCENQARDCEANSSLTGCGGCSGSKSLQWPCFQRPDARSISMPPVSRRIVAACVCVSGDTCTATSTPA